MRKIILKKKSRIFFDEKKFNIFFGILQIATLVKIFKKTHFFKKNDEKNQNFKNSNDRHMKHPMGWVRAKYQLQRSSDGFSKSTPVILPKTFNLLRKSQKSNVNQQKVYMPKKYVENPPTQKKVFGIVIIIVLIACKFLEQSEQLYIIEDF